MATGNTAEKKPTNVAALKLTDDRWALLEDVCGRLSITKAAFMRAAFDAAMKEAEGDDYKPAAWSKDE